MSGSELDFIQLARHHLRAYRPTRSEVRLFGCRRRRAMSENLVVRATRTMAGASRHAVGRSKAVVVPVDVSRRALPVCRETAIPSLKWIKSR